MIIVTYSKYMVPLALVRSSLEPYGVRPSPAQAEAIQLYVALLIQWNQKVSLTSLRAPTVILQRHFGECMFAASAVPISGGRLADVGSGGGFPGLALKIACPALHVFLIESNVKKATFLAEVIRELGLAETRVLVSPYEELGEEVAPLDFVCSRALGEFNKFLGWAHSERVAVSQAILWEIGRAHV